MGNAGGYHPRMADIDLTPTEEMASNAARGLELREKHGRGGTAVGVARARDIKNRKNLSPDTVRRMHSFFSRHAGNEAGGEDDAGYISFLLWGGAAGRSWAKRKSAQLDKDENAMSDTRKEIMERLGFVAEPRATATVSHAGNTLRAEINQRLGLFGKAQFAGDRGCGTGAGGFQPGNTCGKEDGKGGGGDAKKKKTKTKKPTKPRKEPKETEKDRRAAEQEQAAMDRYLDLGGIAIAAADDGTIVLEELEQALSGRVDPRAKRLMTEARHLTEKLEKLSLEVQGLDTEGGSAVRRSVVTAQTIAKQAEAAINRLNQLKGELPRLKKGAKRTPKAHLQKVTENLIQMDEDASYDAFELSLDLKAAGGSRTREGRALRLEVDALTKEIDSVSESIKDVDVDDVYYMEDPAEIKQATEQAIAATKQFAELLRRGQELSRRITELSKRPRRGKKATSSRKRRFGLLDRLGAAAGALTQKTVSPSTPAYQNTLQAAKKQAIEAVKSYEYVRDLNDQQFKALDDYVKVTAKAIATLKSVQDIQRLTAGIVRATTSRNHARQYLKTPFSRPGAKVHNAIREGKKVSASDDAVARKIRKLMDEGKPQKQAVAIALDLERRGEL
jgi:hypothetical protein